MRDSTERHPRVGIVTNQPGPYDPGRPHASTTVCDRRECRYAAAAWVAAKTGEEPVFISDRARSQGGQQR